MESAIRSYLPYNLISTTGSLVTAIIAATIGAYSRVVFVLNKLLVAVLLCVENGLAVIYFRPRGLLNLCPTAFPEQEIQSAIERSLPTPTHQRKALGTDESRNL